MRKCLMRPTAASAEQRHAQGHNHQSLEAGLLLEVAMVDLLLGVAMVAPSCILSWMMHLSWAHQSFEWTRQHEVRRSSFDWAQLVHLPHLL